MTMKNGKISYEEAKELINWFNEWADLSHPISIGNSNFKGENTDISYIKNEDNKTFNCSTSANRKCKTLFLDGNKYEFYETFEMTKYDATNKVKVILYYYGEPITLVLERINS